MVDREAARRATTASAVVLVAIVVASVAFQSAVAAAFTGGQQPVAAVEQVPTAPGAAAWDDATTRTVDLSKQQMALPFGGGSVDELDVQAVTNESHVAFRLTWRDPTNDTSLAAPRAFSDAAAVMFGTGEKPPITMGAAGSPVDVWYWRANWQYGDHRGTGAGTGDMYAYPHPDDETKPGAAAGNPVSKTDYREFAQDYYAKGFGSLSHAPSQQVRATGERTDEGWSVVFVRPRTVGGQYTAPFDGSTDLFLAFAVWNGSAGEVNGQKSITLRFSTMDPSTGDLTVPASGTQSSGGGSSDGGQAGDGSSAQVDIPLDEPADWPVMAVGLLAVVVATWVGVYWEGRR